MANADKNTNMVTVDRNTNLGASSNTDMGATVYLKE